MTRTIRKGRLARLVALSAAAMLLATMVGQVSAASVEPTLVLRVPGQGGQWACDGGTKMDPVADGTVYAPDGVEIDIDVRWTAEGPVFDFDAGDDYVNSVLVKGGPNANLYDYGAGGRSSDTGLHAPYNDNSGKWYGLSFLCFYSTKK